MEAEACQTVEINAVRGFADKTTRLQAPTEGRTEHEGGKTVSPWKGPYGRQRGLAIVPMLEPGL